MTESTPDATPPASGRTLVLGIGMTVLVLIAAGVVAVMGSGQDTAPGSDVPVVEDADDPFDRSTIAERIDPGSQAPLPDITLGAFGEGDPVATSDYRGTPLVLNFWGSWCAPCVEEMPHLQGLADAGSGKLAVLGVNFDDRPEPAQELIDSLGITFDLAVDDGGALFREVEGFGMPTTLFVDADGQIRYRYTGPLEPQVLADLVAEHLGVDVAPSG